jgi:hypothetical protein
VEQLRESYLGGIALELKFKFEEEGQALLDEVRNQTDLDCLRRFLHSIESADSIDQLRKLLP